MKSEFYKNFPNYGSYIKNMAWSNPNRDREYFSHRRKNIDLGVMLCLSLGSWVEVSVSQPLGHDPCTFTQGSPKTTVKHRHLYCDL